MPVISHLLNHILMVMLFTICSVGTRGMRKDMVRFYWNHSIMRAYGEKTFG